MNRKNTLAYMQIAGYHEDMGAFLTLYIESRISKPIANDAYQAGFRQKKSGMKCNCHECSNKGT